MRVLQGLIFENCVPSTMSAGRITVDRKLAYLAAWVTRPTGSIFWYIKGLRKGNSRFLLLQMLENRTKRSNVATLKKGCRTTRSTDQLFTGPTVAKRKIT